MSARHLDEIDRSAKRIAAALERIADVLEADRDDRLAVERAAVTLGPR